MQQPCALLLLLLLPTVLGRPVQVPFDASHVRVDSGGALQRPASGGVAAEGTFGQIPAVEGDSWMMSIAIPELYAGRYALNVTALTGPAQGTVQIRVNGTTIGTFNGYAEAVALQTQHVGAVHLEGGIYELGGVVTSKDERSQGFAFHCATVDFQREHQVRRRLQQPASSCTAKPAAVAAAAEMCNATAQGVDEGLCGAAALNGSAAACTSVGRCTYTAAVAAVAGYSCTQPAANATTCRESQDCVFTPASSGGAGSCALTDSAACAAALSADVDGSTCRALKCIYTGPAAGPASSDGEWIHCRRAIAQLTVTQSKRHSATTLHMAAADWSMSCALCSGAGGQ
jgi:hypothetical protein|eukprot:SAG25_NODE_653_length_6144_cov_5.294624_1_plen_343_part_00